MYSVTLQYFVDFGSPFVLLSLDLGHVDVVDFLQFLASEEELRHLQELVECEEDGEGRLLAEQIIADEEWKQELVESVASEVAELGLAFVCLQLVVELSQSNTYQW